MNTLTQIMCIMEKSPLFRDSHPTKGDFSIETLLKFENVVFLIFPQVASELQNY